MNIVDILDYTSDFYLLDNPRESDRMVIRVKEKSPLTRYMQKTHRIYKFTMHFSSLSISWIVQ
jgi:hypothetical protein